MTDIKFPQNLKNPGFDFLDYEIPWIVPDSLIFLDKIISPSDVALDLGSGGSTLYFLKKLLKVYAIETNSDWFQKVKDRVAEKSLDENLKYFLATDQDNIITILNSITSKINVATVDTMKGINRTALLSNLLQRPEKPEIIILDNWAHSKMFKGIASLSNNELLEKFNIKNYEVFDFYHNDWIGNGTRLLVNINRL